MGFYNRSDINRRKKTVIVRFDIAETSIRIYTLTTRKFFDI